MATTAVERPKTRSDLAQLAGRGPFSFIAVLAGVLIGYATFALLLGGTAAILRGNGWQLDLSENWGDLSSRGGLLLGALLFVSYLFAGYIAGRMAWRRGAAHGLLVVFGSVLLVAVAAALLQTFTKPDNVEGITDALKSFGVPTTAEDWGNVGPVVWVASAAGMVLGALVGGLLGERWFTRVSRGALDAEIDIRERLEASSERPGPAEGTGTKDGNGHRARTGNGNRTADVTDFDSMSKDELYQRAQEQEIPGRSQMTKDELASALKKQERRSLQKH